MKKILLAVLILSTVATLGQAASIDRLFEELSAVRHFKEVAISPDGTHVAWVEEPDNDIYLVEWKTPGAAPRHIGKGQSLAWSPDGRRFVATAAPGPADNNWWLARLYTLSLESGHMQPIFRPTTQIAVPRWSPDGKSIAFVQGLMSDEGFTGGDLFTIDAGGGDALRRTVHWFEQHLR